MDEMKDSFCMLELLDLRMLSVIIQFLRSTEKYILPFNGDIDF